MSAADAYCCGSHMGADPPDAPADGEVFSVLAAAVDEAIGLENYRDASPEDIDTAAVNLRASWLAFLALPEIAALFGERAAGAAKKIDEDQRRCAHCGTVDCASDECEDA